ncbi:MAG: lytic murein transglycosylase [Aurantimonas endophytica]|uniref:Lytic murein transglycosylase n=1 Tax=Aurantimonas endophytica TaxID=1522175 RepID=A0A7W6HCM0_9HYPH|nr:lytic murein transglycosylase [Aurantimonas endophytica]MBB4002709.1 lytic murein transglycosylase [Aurantimonas endophytica]MCO6403588.1 lytic murein transglycosylase [Aurantimonas endophytica]
MLRTLLAVTLFLCTLAPAGAQNLDAGFRTFLESDIWPAARQRGVPRPIFDQAFQGVSLNLKLPDLQLPGSGEGVAETNFQAEFRSGADYLSERNVAGNVSQGRALLQRHKALLDRIVARYGVPAPIIVAIWGRESGFGAARIPENAFQVLGTKAYLARRKAMFREELIAALQIVADGHLKVSEMKSSWAGALGQPQFMPTKFLALAVDFDGDGRKDIWNSVPDTLASIAHYLRQSGWQPGRDWGFEVVVPEGVSCANEGPDRGRPISEFAAAGVTRVSGRPFPTNELGARGHLMMPAGRNGPAFIATPNFYVIKEYNNSDLYALFVGHAADRKQGAGPLAGRWRDTDRLTRGDVARMQQKLIALGYDVGGADGLAGFKTRRSIGDFEAKNGMAATCWPSRALAGRL